MPDVLSLDLRGHLRGRAVYRHPGVLSRGAGCAGGGSMFAPADFPDRRSLPRDDAMGRRGPDDLIESEWIAGGHLLWPVGDERPPLEWCDPSALAASTHARTGGTGRGATLYFDVDRRTLVLRRYRRGGMVQRLGDRYLRLGLRRSRAWRELSLLAWLRQRDLPVPRPVAARVEPLAPWSPFHRAILLTEYLPGTETLALTLRERDPGDDTWRRIGTTIAHMHHAGVDHADLNAHNILLGADDCVFLIDFDRGRLHAGAGEWRERNLARLRRSLDKLAGQGTAGFAFSDDRWQALERAYRAESSTVASASA